MRSEALISGEDFVWRSWGALIHSVRTGETAFDHIYGMDTWEWFKQHPTEARLFDDFMTELTRVSSQNVAEGYDFSRARVVVDIGGGAGELLSVILTRNPKVRGVLFDLDHVVMAAKSRLAPPVADRMQFISGDFFKSIAPGGDIYILKFIIHDWNDARSVEILTNIRKAMKGNAKLLMVEELICSANQSCRAKIGDINMLVRTGGRNRTAGEYRELLAKAGFDVERILPLDGVLAVIESISRPRP